MAVENERKILKVRSITPDKMKIKIIKGHFVQFYNKVL